MKQHVLAVGAFILALGSSGVLGLSQSTDSSIKFLDVTANAGISFHPPKFTIAQQIRRRNHGIGLRLSGFRRRWPLGHYSCQRRLDSWV